MRASEPVRGSVAPMVIWLLAAVPESLGSQPAAKRATRGTEGRAVMRRLLECRCADSSTGFSGGKEVSVYHSLVPDETDTFVSHAPRDGARGDDWALSIALDCEHL